MMTKPQDIEPPPRLDPLIAEFIAALARAAVRRERRNTGVQKSQPTDT